MSRIQRLRRKAAAGSQSSEAQRRSYSARSWHVKLRCFAGLIIVEAAAAVGISVGTANRHWAYAKARLYQQLNDGTDTAL